MLKTLLFSIVAFMIFATPARATTCQNPNGFGVVKCEDGWTLTETPCEDRNGEPVYGVGSCRTGFDGSGNTSAKMSTTEVVILTVGVGLVVAGLAYYFFHKKPSQNNPGQISLMAF